MRKLIVVLTLLSFHYMAGAQSLNPGVIGNDQHICYGSVPGQLIQVTPPSGGTLPYSFLWQESNDGGNTWTSISDANSVEYNPPAITTNKWYRRTVSDGLGSTGNSNNVIISVFPEFSLTQLSGNMTMYYNTSANFYITLTGGASPYTINYTVDGEPHTAINNYISRASISTGVYNTSGTYIYSLTSVIDANGCAAQSLGTNMIVTVTDMQNESPNLIDFSSIPKDGTALIYSHQDDDVLWMLPFWNISEKFISGAMPGTPAFTNILNEQQVFLNNNGYNISYESNSLNPWESVTHQSYAEYYWNNNHNYDYIANDHITSVWDENNALLTRIEINKIKAKLEQYIANPDISRIITHNNWGEYGHQHHKAVNIAVRELAVKYRKDVWMLGSTGDFVDITVPSDLTWTWGNYDVNLFTEIRNIYLNNGCWTWGTEPGPSGNHKFIKIVESGSDKSNILTGESITASGPYQSEPGAYIFDGSDDYMTITGNNYSSFTITMRVNPDQIKGMDISKMTENPTSGTFDRSFFLQNDGKVNACINDGNSRIVTSNTALTAGYWTHIAMTSDGSMLKIYINGILENSISAGTANTVFSTPEFIIGKAGETTSYFKGQINDVRLYDYALTDSEIASLNGIVPPIDHTIIATAGAGGSITPSGTLKILEGGSRTYSIVASSGYQIFDVKVDNISQGPLSTYVFKNILANHTIEVSFLILQPSLAYNKPATCQSSEGTGFGPSFANDADRNSYWAASPYTQWWTVDLEAIYDLNSIVIRNYVDGVRYYHYNIEASVDNVTFAQIAEKADNNPATDAGDLHNINTTARYIRVNMIFSSANPGVHISDFRAYGTLSTQLFTINSSAGAGGYISPSGNLVVNRGENHTYTMSPSSGYQISNVIVDNTYLGPITSFTFSEVAANHTINVTFSPLPSLALNKPTSSDPATLQNPSYMANDSDGTNNSYWSASPWPTWWQVDLGENYNLTSLIIRNYVCCGIFYHYNIEVSTDGINYTQIINKTDDIPATDGGDYYTVANIVARYIKVNMNYCSDGNGVHISDFRVYGTPAPPTDFTITATASAGGSINPSGGTKVLRGGELTYSIACIHNDQYQISDVLIDGVSVGPLSSYTFTNVTGNHTISANFSAIPSVALNKITSYDPSAVQSWPSGNANDADGSNNSYWAATPWPTWWQVDLGENFGLTSLVIRNYVCCGLYYHYNIEVSVDGINYYQVITKINNDPATDAGDYYALENTPARYLRVNMTYCSDGNGVHISDFRVYGTPVSINKVISDAGMGGIISPSGTTTVIQGTSLSFTITPNSGFRIADVMVDGTSIGPVSSYTFTNVAADHTITATFSTTISSNVALNKPTSCQSHQGSWVSSLANDGDGTNSSYWQAKPYPQWWKVDLGAVYDLTSLVIRNYFQGSRYYQYFIQVSTDDINYTQIASKVNRNIATDAGDTYSISSSTRYIRVNMTYNSANMGVQISDFRAYGIPSVGLPSYNIISSAGPNGLISPSGTVMISQNSSQTFTISANSGYKITDVLVDGVSVGAVSSYKFNSVFANHTITATFSVLNTYSVIGSAGTGGTITPSGVLTVDEGSSQTYTITPNPGYQILNVIVDNVSHGSISTYSFTDITANHTISAAFIPTFTISSRAGLNGSISPTGSVIVSQGGTQTFTITANTGYEIAYVLVDNVSMGKISTYTFENVVSSHTIRATFSPTYTITPRAGLNGSISPSVQVIISQGGTQTFTITANMGYQIADVLVDNMSVGAISTYTFENVVANHTIRATFSLSAKGEATSSSPELLKLDEIPETLPENTSLTVYPNPFKDWLTIRIDSPVDELFDIYIVNMIGRNVFVTNNILGNTENIFNLNLPQGTYILIVRDQERTMVQRIVKY